ncbi:MAG: cation transporter [Bacteroidota bacterium]|nr:cation transporter [Bacteroidota bacterium]
MRLLKINIAVILTLSFIIGCGKNENKVTENKSTEQKSVTKVTSEQTENIEIKLPTIQCGTCKKNIEGTVKKIDGVKDVNVIVKEKIAKVNYDKSKTDQSNIEEMIVRAGYQANDKPANKDSYDKLADCCKIGGHDN